MHSTCSGSNTVSCVDSDQRNLRSEFSVPLSDFSRPQTKTKSHPSPPAGGEGSSQHISWHLKKSEDSSVPRSDFSKPQSKIKNQHQPKTNVDLGMRVWKDLNPDQSIMSNPFYCFFILIKLYFISTVPLIKFISECASLRH